MANQQNEDQTNEDDVRDNSNPTKSATELNLNHGGGSNDNRACASCKYQRKRCAPDCPLAPHFPPEHPDRFANAHKVFGLRNLLKVHKQVHPQHREIAMKTMIWEAEARARDPVGGCLRIIQQLENEIELHRAEWAMVRSQLDYYQNLGAAAEAFGGPSGSKEPSNTAYFQPEDPGGAQSFGGIYPELHQSNSAVGLGFHDNGGNPARPESYIPVEGYQDAMAVISNKYKRDAEALTPSSSTHPESFFTAAGGYEEALGMLSKKTKQDGETLTSSSSDPLDSFFPVGGYQEALSQAIAYSSVVEYVDHDVGLLSKKLRLDAKAIASSSVGEYVDLFSKKLRLDAKAIASSSVHPPTNLPVSGYGDHDVGFISNNLKSESPRVNVGETKEKLLKSQSYDGRGGGEEC